MARNKAFNEAETLEKAMCLFWEKGYMSTSVQDLVKHLGINRASLYATYGDKMSLFTKAYLHYCQTNQQSTKQFLSNYTEVKTGLQKLFESAFEDVETAVCGRGCFAVNSTVELVPNEPKFRPLMTQNRQQFESIFRDYLALGIERGQIPPNKNIEALAVLLFTFYSGLKVVTKVTDDMRPLRSSVEELLSTLDGE